jgi:hypothetical protein
MDYVIESAKPIVAEPVLAATSQVEVDAKQVANSSTKPNLEIYFQIED